MIICLFNSSSNSKQSSISTSATILFDGYFNLFDSTRIDPIKNFDEVKNMTVDTASSLIIDKLKIKDFDFSSIPVTLFLFF